MKIKNMIKVTLAFLVMTPFAWGMNDKKDSGDTQDKKIKLLALLKNEKIGLNGDDVKFLEEQSILSKKTINLIKQNKDKINLHKIDEFWSMKDGYDISIMKNGGKRVFNALTNFCCEQKFGSLPEIKHIIFKGYDYARFIHSLLLHDFIKKQNLKHIGVAKKYFYRIPEDEKYTIIAEKIEEKIIENDFFLSLPMLQGMVSLSESLFVNVNDNLFDEKTTINEMYQFFFSQNFGFDVGSYELSDEIAIHPLYKKDLSYDKRKKSCKYVYDFFKKHCTDEALEWLKQRMKQHEENVSEEIKMNKCIREFIDKQKEKGKIITLELLKELVALVEYSGFNDFGGWDFKKTGTKNLMYCKGKLWLIDTDRDSFLDPSKDNYYGKEMLKSYYRYKKFHKDSTEFYKNICEKMHRNLKDGCTKEALEWLEERIKQHANGISEEIQFDHYKEVKNSKEEDRSSDDSDDIDQELHEINAEDEIDENFYWSLIGNLCIYNGIL